MSVSTATLDSISPTPSISLEKIIANLMAIAELAMAKGTLAVALRANLSAAKMLGFLSPEPKQKVKPSDRSLTSEPMKLEGNSEMIDKQIQVDKSAAPSREIAPQSPAPACMPVTFRPSLLETDLASKAERRSRPFNLLAPTPIQPRKIYDRSIPNRKLPNPPIRYENLAKALFSVQKQP